MPRRKPQHNHIAPVRQSVTFFETAKQAPVRARWLLPVQAQFGSRFGTIVTIDGKNPRISSPTTWISTKGMIPR